MQTQRPQEPTYHVLLIGIDSYSVKPLSGCVNDIDAVQQILMQRADIGPGQVMRLASPLPDSNHDSTVPTAPATLANIRAALNDLGSDRVAPNDRVFIYYAGHGARQAVIAGEHTIYCESLLPVDFNDGANGWNVLYDFELNELLARIAARTSAVSLVLDCCHSTGAIRDVPDDRMTSRFIDFERDLGGTRMALLPASSATLAGTSTRGITAAISQGVDQCQVVAACLDHEIAKESVGADGLPHGLLTRAFIEALSRVPAEEIRTVPWGRVWNGMWAAVEQANPAQHLWISGGLARAVLAGPPTDGDVGLGVVRTGPNEYRIDAGTVAGITANARIAVYGERPFKFPPLNSPQDHDARFTRVLLKVTNATRSSAKAEAEGTPFDPPPGARGRLVRPSAPERVGYAVVPENEVPGLSEDLAASPLLQVTSEKVARVRLERGPDGNWFVTDDVHGPGPEGPVLFTLSPGQLPWARLVLEHYVRYSAPLRMAELCTELPGALRISLLAVPRSGVITPAEAQAAAFPELPRGAGRYDLSPGQEFCIRVNNSSTERLRVTIVNSAASGRVEWLGDQIIDPKATHAFWLSNELGRPFEASLPAGSTQGIDRLVAIGTTALGSDLKHLEERRRFRDLLEESGRDFARDLTDRAPPADRWTAAEAVVRTSRDVFHAGSMPSLNPLPV